MEEMGEKKKKRGEKQESENVTLQPVALPVAKKIIEAPSIPEKTDNVVGEESEKSKIEEEKNHVIIKSSMIGTFYRGSSPDQPPFVSVGDVIKQADTICIIEAMKLFNEIESEISGTIIKVLVDDATPVEFDQPLFLVDVS